jgi:hypothetical protein
MAVESNPCKVKGTLMALARTKPEIIKRLHAERRRLEANLATLTPDQMCQPGAVGTWSFKDVLAHLAEWEAHMPVWVGAARHGETVEQPDWKNLDGFNDRLYQRHKDQSLDEVLAYFNETHHQFMEMAEAMPEEEMLTPSYYPFTGKGAIWDWLNAYAAHDMWGKDEIRTWIKTSLQGLAGQTSWYILEVYPGKERQVKEKLDKRFRSRSAQPTAQVVVPFESLTGNEEAKNYVGLVFIQICLEPASWTIIRNTPGVTGFVGMGVNPTPFQVSDWKQIPLSRFASSGKT